MNTYAVQSQTDVTEVDGRESLLRMPDPASAAETALNGALNYCVAKLGVGGIEEVLESLRHRQMICQGYFNYALAKNVADYLGAFDEAVKAAYLFEYDATPEDVCFCETSHDHLIHVIVHVGRRTAALQSMLQALDSALTSRYADLTGAGEVAHVLDVHIVNDDDVRRRCGYGALLSSVHHRPLQLWLRDGHTG